MERYSWCGVYCGSERAQTNVRSWFGAFVPADWGLPLKADIQEEMETGRETQIRALFRLPNGRLKEAVRRMNKRNTKIVMRDASPGILENFRGPPCNLGGEGG